MKLPVAVLTLTSSPLSRYSGTWISSPVTSVAGLVLPVAVAPFTPGVVSAIVRLTDCGSSMARISPSTSNANTKPNISNRAARELSAAEIVEKGLSIAGDICVFTNHNHSFEALDYA